MLVVHDPIQGRELLLLQCFCKLEGVKWESAYRGSRNHKFGPVVVSFIFITTNEHHRSVRLDLLQDSKASS